MKTYLQKAMAFIRDEDGASAVEYAILIGVIAVGVAAAAVALVPRITAAFTAAGNSLPAAGG